MEMVSYATPIRDLINESDLPTDFLTTPDGPLASVLDKLFFIDYALVSGPDGIGLTIELVVAGEAAISLPGLAGFGFVLGSEGAGVTLIDASFFISQRGFSARLDDVTVALRFPPSILKPVPELPGTEAPPYAQIEVHGSVILDENFDLHFEGFDNLTLKPVMIGNCGVVISAENIELDFSRTETLPEIVAAGFDESFMGIYIGEAKVQLPKDWPAILPRDLFLRKCAIGSGGVSGELEADYTPNYNSTTKEFTGDGAGKLFGIPFGLEQVSLKFKQNAFQESKMAGQLLLPFFEKLLRVEIGLSLDGSFAVKLTSTVEPGDPMNGGLLTLKKPGLLDLIVESLSFQVQDGVFTAKLSGKITPRFGNLDWPSFQVKELTIDSNGNVRLEGGWLDLREQYSLNFHGFQIEITKLGFGKTEDGGKWIGFSGSFQLVDGLSAGASVEGLRIIWYDDDTTKTKITLNGVGVEFEVPDVLRFKGAVSWKGDRFDGDIKLELISLDLQVDGTLVIGEQAGITYFAIYLSLNLPSGIPLFATGLALYGMEGFFALQMAPNKGEGEEWYENADGSPGWYKRSPIGVTRLTDPGRKWDPHPGADVLALGAGVTIGTASDNGYIFSGRMLLVLAFPGPVLLIQGKANLLRERAKLDGDDPIFRALAVLDNRAGTFLIGLDAQYKFDGTGKLIDIRGGAEAFFSLSDASLWHLYLGKKDPREKRIRAQLLSIFEANAYLMLDAHQLATGAWLGYHEHWEFGPLGVTLQAWIDGNAVISWKPVHFHGDLWLHGKAELHVFWIDLGLTVDAKFAADVFDPFHIRAGFSVCVSMPWPFDDICADITLEWGPDHKRPTPPHPLKEIAVEHLKVTTSWPLPPDGSPPLLVPNYDRGDGFLLLPQPTFDPNTALPAQEQLPVVPLDCRPHITFGRHVNDDALVGVKVRSDVWERIGDPAKNEGPVKIRYGLKGVALHKWNPQANSWTPVARKGSTGLPDDTVPVKELFGSWAPVPDDGGQDVGQTKLFLWSKTPFDYTRHSGRAWDDWFMDALGDYPCVPIPPDREICCDFKGIDPNEQLRPPWPCAGQPEFVFSWLVPDVQTVTVVDPVQGTKALCFPSTLTLPDGSQRFNEITIYLLEPAKRVVITLRQNKGVQVIGYDAQGTSYVVTGEPNQPEIVVAGEDLVRVVLQGKSENCILRVCAVVGLDEAERIRRAQLNQHLIDEMARWSQEGDVLEPHTTYRLLVVTHIDTQDKPIGSFEQTESAYFRTEGPPGLTYLSVPRGLSAPIGKTNPPFTKAGTVTVTNGSPNVTGTGTDWSDRLVGAVLQVGDETTGYTIATVTAPNQLVLRHGYLGSTRSDATYIISQFASGLDDLTRYVRQTMPATVPAEGNPPLLPRPVYRAFDVGVEFNENYVDLMYRLGRRDLGLYLYNNNNDPVRDAKGRLIVLSNRWGVTDELTLTESEKRWIIVVNRSDCGVTLNSTDFPHDTTLTSAAEGQVLDADTVYEARLVPLLLHENFGDFVGKSVDGPSGVLERWSVQDEGSNAGPSHWEVHQEGTPPSPYLIQTSGIRGVTVDSSDLVKPGTMLLREDNPALGPDHHEQPGNWTDYRLSVYLRFTSGAVGVVVRYLEDGIVRPEEYDINRYYRFSMDQQGRRLVRMRKRVRIIFVGGSEREVVEEIPTVLAEDDCVSRQNQDYLITVEAIGSSLRVFQDGALVFDVTDTTLDHGRIGLYCWADTGARFSDVRVDDFRADAPVVYRFKFTTSHFANFFHHLQSFQDETWKAELPANVLSDAAVSELVAKAATPSTMPSDDEARAYEALVQALGQAVMQNPPEVQVTRVERNGQAFTLLLQSSEPFDWKRTDFSLWFAHRRVPLPTLPGAVKFTDVTFGTDQPNEESMTLLLREPTSLTGYRVEYHQLPGPIAEPIGDPVLFVDDFDRAGDNQSPLDPYTIVNEGAVGGPSQWRLSCGALVQTSNIGGGSAPADPGTFAVTGDPTWTDTRLTVVMRSDSGTIGVLFRYVDENNYYRLSSGPQGSFRRLIKKENGTVTLLWSDNGGYTTGDDFTLTVDVRRAQLTGYMGDERLFDVKDGAPTAGRIALYCAGNTGARFERVEVRRLPLEALALLRDRFAFGDTSAWSFFTTGGSSSIVEGALRLTSGAGATEDGTQALANPTWTNMVVSSRLRSEGFGVIGLLFGYSSAGDYYRFSLDMLSGARRLERKSAGMFMAPLWEDTLSVNALHSNYEVTIVSIDGTLRGFLEGVPLFVIEDSDALTGRIGLFCQQNSDARFSAVSVYPPEQAFEDWLLDEPFDVLVPERWSFVPEGDQDTPANWEVRDGEMRQTSSIFGGGPPKMPGTYALAGEATWADYSVSVRLCSDVDSDTPVSAIGVMFRYQDENNYYRFSLDTEQGGHWLLIKKVANVVTVLGEHPRPFTRRRDYVLTVDCVDDQLSVYIDGMLVFAVSDSDVAAGRIGLYAWRNPGARFAEVRVAGPTWVPYYTFGQEARLPAGTGVRLYAGNEADAPPVQPEDRGVVRRFVAPLDEHGQVRLTPQGTDLRLVPTGKTAEHMRRFLPDDTYARRDVRVLRNRDETSFFVVPAATPPGSPLEVGQYRLAMTYRRNNQAIDADSQVFSETGNTSDEKARIDIPWQVRNAPVGDSGMRTLLVRAFSDQMREEGGPQADRSRALITTPTTAPAPADYLLQGGAQEAPPTDETPMQRRKRMYNQMMQQQLGWTQDMWKHISDAVTAEADGVRVITKAFPVWSLPGARNVSAEVFNPQTLSAVDSEGQTLSFIEVSQAFTLTQNQVDNEQALKLCEMWAKLTAVSVVSVAEQIIAQGAAFVAPQGVKVQRLSSAGVGLLSEAQITIPVDPLRNKPGVYGGNTFDAVTKGIAELIKLGQPGPYLLLLQSDIFGDTGATVGDTLTTTADRLIRLVPGGFYGTPALPAKTGLLASLGGAPTVIAIRDRATLEFTEKDRDEGTMHFRVFESFQHIVWDLRALVKLEFK
jgi:uncharacterized linocin/CFP29 family protein